MLPSITKAAHPIAAAVTVIVIAGQWCRRKARIGMQTYGFQIELANSHFDACHSLCRNINRRSLGEIVRAAAGSTHHRKNPFAKNSIYKKAARAIGTGGRTQNWVVTPTDTLLYTSQFSRQQPRADANNPLEYPQRELARRTLAASKRDAFWQVTRVQTH
jgi:hypothetical protein